MDQTTDNGGRILLVDDEAAILRTFRYCLEDRGYTVMTAASAAQAEAILQRQVFDLCFLDLRLGEDNGLDVLQQMRTLAPWMRVVIVTAHSAVDTAVDAMQAGAADYLLKPCSPEQLRLSAAKQLEVRQMAARLEALEGEMKQRSDALGSHSPAMMAVLETARQVADTDANILILGESGTGKGELARAIHTWSRRSKKAFVTINCPSLSADLMESELFGHNRGAFTGATESTLGRVNQADGGTLFLDEIGDMPLLLQAKLLRVLQEGEVRPLGSTETHKVDVRIVAATHRDLRSQVENGLFREDLFYRLSHFPIELPPLREREEDILRLARHFADKACAFLQRDLCRWSDAALERLAGYAFPGNVRELKGLVERAVLLCEGGELLPEHFNLHVEASLDSSLNLRERMERVERSLLMDCLRKNGGNQSQAARELGLPRRTLLYRMERLNISPADL